MLLLQNLTLRRADKVLLESTNLVINPKERVGLIGHNGAGKSTLFALFSGSLQEDSGQFSIPSNWRIAQVAQNLPDSTESATAFVLSGDTELCKLQQQLAIAEQNNDGIAIANLHLALTDAGALNAKARAQTLILGLGFQVNQLELPVKSFSGGWQMRLQLARALMAPSDLLLLDEPTNHLDLDALVWLEDWLRQYSGTLIIISHDREFLDAITNVTVHIEHKKLNRYSGNYSSFEVLRSQQLNLQQSAYIKQQEKIAHLEKFIARFKAKASKAKQAQSRVKALAKMQTISPILEDAQFNFSFAATDNLPNPMLKIEHLCCGYQADKAIISQVNRNIIPGQRIGILGANGQGKSTFIKTITQTIAPLSGKITQGKGLRIGYFAQQELDVLQIDSSPLEHLIALAKQHGHEVNRSSREQDLRNFLGQFNFNQDMVKQPVGSMSGGEKARLVLCMLVWLQPNLLLLDEPTNHLDLITREALALALNSFEGSLMLVSHDRALLRSVCDEFWLVTRGQVQDFDGDLEDYQSFLLAESKRQRELARNGTNAGASSGLNQRELRKQQSQKRLQLQQTLAPLKKQLTKVETQMTKAEQQKNAVTEQFSQPQTTEQLIELNKNFKQLEQQLQLFETQWLELSEQIEQLANA